MSKMTDKEFYKQLDDTIDELMAGVPKIVCDIGRLNDILIELHTRQRNLTEGV